MKKGNNLYLMVFIVFSSCASYRQSGDMRNTGSGSNHSNMSNNTAYNSYKKEINSALDEKLLPSIKSKIDSLNDKK